MSTFDDLRDCPVIHTQRNDGVTLIATRVPLDDIRLEQWGWLLTLNRKDGKIPQDDIESLRDNNGHRYPKVYPLSDMKGYIDQWGCTEWDEGYRSNGNGKISIKSCTPSDVDTKREEVFRQVLGEVQGQQHEQAVELQTELKAYIASSMSEVGKSNTEFYETWNGQIMDYFNRLLEHSRGNFEYATKQLDLLDQKIETQLLQTREAVTKLEEDTKNQLLLGQQEEERYKQAVCEEIKNQTSLGQKNTLEAISALFPFIQQDIQKMLLAEREEMSATLGAFSGQINGLQDQIKQVLEELDPEIEPDADKSESADTASTPAKVARKVTSQIERIAANQQKMSMSYYNSANEQAKQGFNLAWLLSIMGAVLLAVTIISAVFMTMMHLYGYTALLGAVGAFATAVSAGMGGLSSLQARTAKQFIGAHERLDRSYRSTIAHAMVVGYTDENHKQAAIDKIIEELLKNEDTTKK